MERADDLADGFDLQARRDMASANGLRTYPALARIEKIIRALGLLVIALAIVVPVAYVVLKPLMMPSGDWVGLNASDIVFIVVNTVSVVLSGMLILAVAELIGLARNVAMDIQRMSQK